MSRFSRPVVAVAGTCSHGEGCHVQVAGCRAAWLTTLIVAFSVAISALAFVSDARAQTSAQGETPKPSPQEEAYARLQGLWTKAGEATAAYGVAKICGDAK